ncbi:hypothetical protein [Leptospira licerasiae]|uniref:hypothetical protein n=1 Tax=Leptospira licerasiae TaxID=447106 RepID=UPI001082A840|nr:hypothetical protein [Leptospira licerasiae]TGM87889.1 hypothetical protein EHR05_14625 [Leptospira licerasiae]
MDQNTFLEKAITWIKGNWKIVLFIIAIFFSYASGCINATILQSNECKASGIIKDPIHFSGE